MYSLSTNQPINQPISQPISHYHPLPKDRNAPTTFQEFNIITLEAAVWQVIQKMANSGKLPSQYLHPYCKPKDFMIREIWWNVLLVTFTPGKRLKPIFCSKAEVCKRLSPGAGRQRSPGGNKQGSGELSFEPEVQKYSPRIGSMSYWSHGELRPWTWYIEYPDSKEGRAKATEMSVYLHQKELAWAATVRRTKRMKTQSTHNQSNSIINPINPINPQSNQSSSQSSNQSNSQTTIELKIWGLDIKLAQKLVQKDHDSIPHTSLITNKGKIG